MSTTDAKETVREIVQQLVAHFRQDIHARVRIDLSKSVWIEEVVSEDTITTTTTTTTMPKIVQFWMDRLEAMSLAQARIGTAVVVENDIHDDEHRRAVILEWLRGYEEFVRPIVFRSPSRNNRLPIFREESASVLTHYELVFSHLVSRYHNEQKRCGDTTAAFQTLQRTIFLLSTDVTLLTATPPRDGSQDNNNDDQTEDNRLCKTEAIPTVLKIVDHTLAMVPPESNCQILQACLRHCAVALMAFETASADGILAPHHLAPSLSTSSHDGDTESTTTGLDVLRRMERELGKDESAILRNYWDNDNDDESFYNDLDDDAWNAMVREQSTRVSSLDWIDPYCNQWLRSVWKRLETLSKPQTSIVPPNEEPSHEQRIALVVEALGGIAPFFEEVRTHFFGRTMHGMEELLTTTTNATPSVVLRMGKRVPVDATTLSEEPPHEVVLSRIAVAVNAMKLLLVPGMMGFGDRNILLEHIFPVCATLVDSNRSALCALGTAGFVRTVDALFWSDKESSSDDYDACASFADNTLSVLDRAFRSSSEPSVILAIGRAQSKILGWMVQQEGRDSDRFRRQRRTVTGQWLLHLEKSMHRRSTKRQPLDLLLGGVIPLLAQHAMDDDQEADGMEVGRLSLAALLPLIANTTPTTGVDVSEDFEEGNYNNDNVDPKTQLASIVALINLLFAAHPVMPGHGGKIISHLLAAAAAVSPTNSNGKSSLNETVRKLAIVAAAFAIVICGPRFAGELVESIETHRDKYELELLAVISEVRELAESLTTNS